MQALPANGPILAPELFKADTRRDAQGLILPAVVMAGLLTGLIYLIM